LYQALAAGIAADPELYRLLLRAPETQRLPVLLFASTHALLLAEPNHRLAAWYPNLTDAPRPPDDPELLTAFKEFVADRASAVHDLLATRSTQTNEVNRCSFLLPALGMIAAECGTLALLDVGASGGLNLFPDRYQYRYDIDGATHRVGPASPVQLVSSIRGDFALPVVLPDIAARIGIDTAPIDITDDVEARWLEACVWPDQADRFVGLRLAIDLARQSPPEILAGDAVELVGSTIERLTDAGHPVVTNSWVLNYLSDAARCAYVAELDRIGASQDLSWVYAESPALTPGIPWGVELDDPHITVLTLATWRSGRRTVRHLASCHPHGFWIHAL
jgi:hypothetical protein